MPRLFLRLVVLVAALTIPSRSFADPISINFDSLSEFDPVTTQLPGLTFSNATVLTSGSSLNDIEFPPHSGQNVIFDDGGPMSIAFSSPVFGVGGFFTYLAPLTLSAYDASSNLIASITSSYLSNLALSGDSGSLPNELLTLTSLAGISSLTISGDSAGGSFVLDDLTFDNTPPVSTPEPTTLVLLGMGLVTAWGVRRRRETEEAVDN